MSCWMMSDKFIAVIAIGIRQAGMKNIYLTPGTFEDCADQAIGGKWYLDERKLFARLKLMNLAAYQGRYGRTATDAVELEFPTLPEAVTIAKNLRDDRTGKAWGAFLKMLRCFMYQCAEAPVYDSEEYKSLERITQTVTTMVVEFNKGYSGAAWGDIPQELRTA